MGGRRTLFDHPYCIDTSALIELGRLPREAFNFAPIWNGFEGLVRDGLLRAPVDVHDEIERAGKDDAITRWCREHREVFFELDPSDTQALTRVLSQCPQLANHASRVFKIWADPIVVAAAAARGMTVVSRESPAPISHPGPWVSG